jgi:hypothetical protein
MLIGMLLSPRTEKVWPETLSWEITTDTGPLLVMFTLLSTALPTGTLPKLTVPGDTESTLPTGMVTPDPQPEIIAITEQARANPRVFPHPLNRSTPVPVSTRDWIDLENTPLNAKAHFVKNGRKT